MTPAISTNMTATITAHVNIVSNGVTVSSTPTSRRVKRKLESRPASKINRKDASGWRQPSSWNHSISEFSPCPQSANVVVRDTRRPKPSDGDFYIDGAAWNETTRGLSAFDSNLKNRAVIQALSRLKNQKVNLGVAFAERERTAQLFFDATKKIASTISHFRSKNPKKIWDLIVVGEGHRGVKLPNAWLEVQYGWKPLMSDVQGAYDALREREGDGRSYNVTVHGRAKSTVSGSWFKATVFSGLFGIKVGFRERQECRVRLDYYLENPVLASLSSLGVTNPALILWEIVPYSFVLDWFSPIGDALGAFDAALAYGFKAGSWTEYRECVQKGVSWQGSGKLNAFQYCEGLGDPQSFYDRRLDVIRSVYTTSPLPRFPGFKNPLSSGHIRNGLSLLASALGTPTKSGWRAR